MARLFILLIVIFMVFASVFGKICTPEDRKPRACTMEIRQGCVCYTNGSCVDRGVNICSECTNPDVVSVTYEPCQ